jgi:uncharacterized RDD family membrane protein YckC
MFCSQCGQRNPDGARFCAQCGSPLPAGAAPQAPAGASLAPQPYDGAFAPPPPPSFADVPTAAPPAYGQGPAFGPPAPSQPAYSAPSYGPPPPPAAAAPSWGPPVPPMAGPVPGYGAPYGAAGYGAAPAMEYKGVMPRFFAAIVDGILMGVAMTVLMFLLSDGFDMSAMSEGDVTALSGLSLPLVLVSWGYMIVFEGLFGGTIGKLILGMRVVNAEGGNAGLGRALVRNLLRIIDMLPFAYLLGAIMVASSDTKQRLGDRVAGTYVVAR